MTVNFAATKTTFDTFVYENSKKTVTRIPVTTTYDNISGSDRLTDGTPDATYTGIFFRKEDVLSQDMQGLMEGVDAIILIKTTQTLVRGDKITFDGETYRVDDIVSRYHNEVKFWIAGRLFKI